MSAIAEFIQIAEELRKGLTDLGNELQHGMPERLSRFPRDPAQRAGQDPDAAGRVAEQPRSQDARLDEALDETMDASDPPSITQPRTHLPPLPPEDASADQRSG